MSKNDSRLEGVATAQATGQPNALADLMQNGKVENIFPTPIFWHVVRDCEELNSSLRKLILDREKSTPSASKSNIGGWQSQPDFFSWNDLSVPILHRYIRVHSMSPPFARLLRSASEVSSTFSVGLP